MCTCEIKKKFTEKEFLELPCVGEMINRQATHHAIAVGKRCFALVSQFMSKEAAEREANEEEMFAYYGELIRLNDLVLREAREAGLLFEEPLEDCLDDEGEDDSDVVIDCTGCTPSASKCGPCTTKHG